MLEIRQQSILDDGAVHQVNVLAWMAIDLEPGALEGVLGKVKYPKVFEEV